MLSKVGKSDREGTVAGARGNGDVAPIPAVRGAAIEPDGSTQNRRSLRGRQTKYLFIKLCHTADHMFGVQGMESGSRYPVPPLLPRNLSSEASPWLLQRSGMSNRDDATGTPPPRVLARSRPRPVSGGRTWWLCRLPAGPLYVIEPRGAGSQLLPG